MLTQNKRLGTKSNTLVLEYNNTHLYIVLNHDITFNDLRISGGARKKFSRKRRIVSVGSSERHQYERNGTELSAIRILITDYYADNAWRRQVHANGKTSSLLSQTTAFSTKHFSTQMDADAMLKTTRIHFYA